MRSIRPRGALSASVVEALKERTRQIAESANPKEEAERLYTNARKARWFEPVVNALREMAGPGERCMFCSGSESSCVEHFKPKAIFPTMAMTWKNFLWVCSICNSSKGDRFPPDTEDGEPLIDPATEAVWTFFFIDEFGNLSARWRTDLDCLDPRASCTIKLLALDRDALQQSRQMRLEDLRKRTKDSLILYRDGRINREDLKNRIRDWLLQPFQPDVADYFLSGPGRKEEPFATLLNETEI